MQMRMVTGNDDNCLARVPVGMFLENLECFFFFGGEGMGGGFRW